ncbi:TetR/AcrR family transcriptional regulator [Congregibacter litoralis]|uniref:Transcriptional regulator, TetR family n=1 Tax=Congregibacter litoralis KT71 TaxID=314285 RepID=A4A5Q3_9GAMM|nr:TetR/AcrR family transcriptional regulator [Congregibacter litoralis]EAQ98350.1 transcriptional regulator, TetR family [Congregibacter litoralis KT71]
MPLNRSSNSSSPFNRKAQHDAKRIAILSEAARLFNGKGSRATTLQDVARGLGLTKTSLYYYVRTKEELIFQCYEVTMQRQHSIMDALDKTALSPLERAGAFFKSQFESWLSAQKGDDVHIAAPLEIASLKPHHRSAIEAEYIRMFKRLRAYLREAMDRGEARRIESTSATRAIIGATDWVFHWLHQLERGEVLAAADAAWDILLHGLSAAEDEYVPATLSISFDSDRPAQGFDRQEQHRQKQEAFYKAGTWFFNRKGFNGASLDQIAEHLNVSKGAFYYHIRNKEDLLFACYQRSIAIVQRIDALAMRTEGSGLQKLDETARRVFHAQNSDAGPLIRYNTITALPTDRRKEILSATEEADSRFDTLIAEGKLDGSIRDVNPLLARRLMSGAINASMDISLWRAIDDIDIAAVEYFDIFYNGLLPREHLPESN